VTCSKQDDYAIKEIFNKMAGKDYSKYIIREPLAFNTFPPYTPRMLFDSKNHFPEMNFGIRYTYINQPIDMEKPHAHDFDQFFCFMGTPEDMRVFDGEVEVYLGEEGTRNIINSTTVVFVPRGMVHCPFKWVRVDKPMMFINIVLSPQYTRVGQPAGFSNSLEVTAQEVTLEEAARILGTDVPLPAYLPEGYRVQEIYTQDDSLRIFISDKALEKELVNYGDAAGARQKYMFECKIEVGIKWYPEGQPGGLELLGEPVTISESKGVLVDRENNIELCWLLPPKSTPEKPGQFEIMLSASKSISRDELLKIARSIS
jgi:hypothetical protein